MIKIIFTMALISFFVLQNSSLSNAESAHSRDTAIIKAELSTEDKAIGMGNAKNSVQFVDPKEMYTDYKGQKNLAGRLGQEHLIEQLLARVQNLKCTTTVNNIRFVHGVAIVNESETVTYSVNDPKGHVNLAFKSKSTLLDKWVKDKSGTWFCAAQTEIGKPVYIVVTTDAKPSSQNANPN